ncbi:MAG: DUF934 domain-containing protein [Myxococcales bacterium]|nr:DUF934 domain-containing protein [Myxococcales bacterium]
MPTEPRRLIVDRQIVEDAWTHVADDAPLPAGPAIVSRERWLAGDAAGHAPLGVLYQPDEDPLADVDRLGELALIAFAFPAFSDGRPLSRARKLRQIVGFTGQIRAVGDVLRDQILYMWRCGFDAFEVRADKSLEDALAAFAEFSVDYQASTPRRLSEG